MTDDPLRCPNIYCRDSDPVVEPVRGWAGVSPRMVECQCGTHGPMGTDDADAIAKWNSSDFRDNYESPEPFCGMFEGPIGVINRPVERVERPDRDPIKRMASALAAAISLLEQGGKSAAPSDKMFEQMLADYRRALANGQRAILGNSGED